MKTPILLVSALALAGCECAPKSNAPAVPMAAALCAAPAAPKAAAPLGPCNQPATAPKASAPSVPMSTVAMPTFVAKAAVVPPNVLLCLINGVRCILDTLISPLRP